jgi:phosphinothricin acetyltransferase
LFEILELQGYKKLIALIVSPNEKSIKLHKKFGFTLSGQYTRIGYKFDTWYDIEFYELTLNEDPPTDILPFSNFIA